MTTELDVIRLSKVKNNILYLPPHQLERRLYMRVKAILEGIGGKWNKKAQGFIFMHDPKPLLEKILRRGMKINFKKDYQLFETPPALAKQMIQLANIKPSDNVLEPSAGRGKIVELMPKGTKIAVVELMPENRQILKLKGYQIIGNDFLKLPLKAKFDKIIANPPFAKEMDIDHILKMYEHLAPFGRLVSLAGIGWTYRSQKKFIAFREFLNKVHAQVRYLPGDTFKESGTNIPATMIIIDKKPFSLKPFTTDYTEWAQNERQKHMPPPPKEEPIDVVQQWNEAQELQKKIKASEDDFRKVLKGLYPDREIK